jgi:phosphoglycerate dehydrogenase-like enzyme
MQLLIGAQALNRISDRATNLLRDLEVVTLAAPGRFERNGQEIPASQIDPDLIWSSLDLYKNGMLPDLLRVVLKGARGQWMQTFNAGLDAPVFRAIMEKGVRITKSDAQSVPIAEYVVGHAISLILPITRQAELQGQKVWAPTPYKEIGQTRWTLIGYGSIGKAIAVRAKAFGAHVTVLRRQVAPDPLVDRVLGLEALGEVLQNSDVVVLACALTDETRNLADDTFFSGLQAGSILINIGRGGLVDEDALRRGLAEGRPAHAVLDVFQTEPLPEDHWIWSHPQIRVSAHTSNSGEGVLARGDELFITNLSRYLSHEALLNEASREEVGLTNIVP